jgi:hypothetical protein
MFTSPGLGRIIPTYPHNFPHFWLDLKLYLILVYFWGGVFEGMVGDWMNTKSPLIPKLLGVKIQEN